MFGTFTSKIETDNPIPTDDIKELDKQVDLSCNKILMIGDEQGHMCSGFMAVIDATLTLNWNGSDALSRSKVKTTHRGLLDGDQEKGFVLVQQMDAILLVDKSLY